MFDIEPLVSGALLITCFALTLSIVFCKSIISVNFNDSTAIYSVIKDVNPSLCNITVDINFNGICIEDGTQTKAKAICYRSLNADFLKNYNITFYSNGNTNSSLSDASNNFLNLPEAALTFNHDYLVYVRNFFIVIICSLVILKLAEILDFKMVQNWCTSKFKIYNYAKRFIKIFKLYILILINCLNLFFTIHLSLNLSSIKEFASQFCLNMLQFNIQPRFTSILWVNFFLLLALLVFKSIFLFAKNTLHKREEHKDLKIDIIQPKI